MLAARSGSTFRVQNQRLKSGIEKRAAEATTILTPIEAPQGPPSELGDPTLPRGSFRFTRNTQASSLYNATGRPAVSCHALRDRASGDGERSRAAIGELHSVLRAP